MLKYFFEITIVRLNKQRTLSRNTKQNLKAMDHHVKTKQLTAISHPHYVTKFSQFVTTGNTSRVFLAKIGGKNIAKITDQSTCKD